jgi:hypothetical protein
MLLDQGSCAAPTLRHKTLTVTARGGWFALSIVAHHDAVVAAAGADFLEVENCRRSHLQRARPGHRGARACHRPPAGAGEPPTRRCRDGRASDDNRVLAGASTRRSRMKNASTSRKPSARLPNANACPPLRQIITRILARSDSRCRRTGSARTRSTHQRVLTNEIDFSPPTQF